MERELFSNAKLSNAIFKSNVNSLISIYRDSELIRNDRILKLDTELEKWSEDNTGRKYDEILDLPSGVIDDYNHYKHHFDYLLMHSLFLSAFSLFEAHLNRVAEITELNTSNRVKLRDIKGNGIIDTTRKYLFIVHELNAANSDRKEWAELLHFKAIRNAIVHNGGLLNIERKHNYRKLPGYKKLEELDVWFIPPIINFRIKNINFLENFRDIAFGYSDGLIQELTVKIS